MEQARTTVPAAATAAALKQPKKDKTQPILSIEPSHHLDFYESRDTSSEASMVLTNLTDGYCAFKIKTTRPKKYCVKPNWGRLGPHEQKVVKGTYGIVTEWQTVIVLASDRPPIASSMRV